MEHNIKLLFHHLIYLLSGVLWCFFCNPILHAQITVTGNNTLQDSLLIAKFLHNSWTVQSPEDALLKLQDTRKNLQKQGYFNADFDLDITDSTKAQFSIHPGPRVYWQNFVFPPDLNEKYLKGTGIYNTTADKTPFNFLHLNRALNKIILNVANNGHPFVSIHLEDIRISEDSISARLILNKGKKYFIQDIEINGTAHIQKSYLRHYLGLKKGKLYSQQTVLAISKKLEEIPFLKQSGLPGVQFYKENAQIYVHLDDRPSDQFDILLGFQPNPPGSAKRFNFIGKALMSLQNNLHMGEVIKLNYNGLVQTQQLQVYSYFPYILDSPFGIQGDFDLYYKDLSYLRLGYRLSVQYALGGNNYMSTFWRIQQSNLVGVDTNAILINRSLPADLDYRINEFGLTWHIEDLDYKLNPTKGWNLDFTLSGGNKSIRQNNLITQIRDVNIDSLYKIVTNQSARGEAMLNAAYYWRLNKRSTIKTSLMSGIIFGQTVVLDNEKFRIGGIRSLRGFNEDQFNSNTYAIGTIEYHFLISQNGYLSAFTDGAYIREAENKTAISALSAGLGFSFETKVGVFQFVYALGRTRKTPWDLTNGKVHFGYLNIF